MYPRDIGYTAQSRTTYRDYYAHCRQVSSTLDSVQASPRLDRTSYELRAPHFPRWLRWLHFLRCHSCSLRSALLHSLLLPQWHCSCGNCCVPMLLLLAITRYTNNCITVHRLHSDYEALPLRANKHIVQFHSTVFIIIDISTLDTTVMSSEKLSFGELTGAAVINVVDSRS